MPDRRSPKRTGELAELLFTYKAALLGLRTLRPDGDSAPYDVVVDNGSRLLRVQVKSISSPYRGVYHVHPVRGAIKRPYRRNELDFLAVYVAPEDTWYIVPARVFAGHQTLWFGPHSRLLRYREAWDQLAAPRKNYW